MFKNSDWYLNPKKMKTRTFCRYMLSEKMSFSLFLLENEN